MGSEFCEHLRKARHTVRECLIQKDPLAVGIAMVHDILEVDRYISQKAVSAPFDPSEIQFLKQVGDLSLSLTQKLGEISILGRPPRI